MLEHSDTELMQIHFEKPNSQTSHPNQGSETAIPGFTYHLRTSAAKWSKHTLQADCTNSIVKLSHNTADQCYSVTFISTISSQLTHKTFCSSYSQTCFGTDFEWPWTFVQVSVFNHMHMVKGIYVRGTTSVCYLNCIVQFKGWIDARRCSVLYIHWRITFFKHDKAAAVQNYECAQKTLTDWKYYVLPFDIG